MSEIFNWLKHNELKHTKSSFTPAEDIPDLPGEEILPLAGGFRSPASEIHSSLSSPILPITPPAMFDLENIDTRIRSVVQPLTIVGEQFRLLRAKLSVLQKERSINSLLITSSAQEEGKTFTACSLAIILAQEPGKRVLLVDADLRKPKVMQRLGLMEREGQYGLSRLLHEEVPLKKTLIGFKNTNLFFLPAGEIPDNPGDLLSPLYLERTFKRLRELFDWIVVDSPPALALADPVLLAAQCDLVLLVVRANFTPANLVQETIERIGRERIGGVILNRIRYIRSSRYYYRYYNSKAKN